MKLPARYLLALAAALSAPAVWSAGVALSGVRSVAVDPGASSGLQYLWVCEKMPGAKLTYTPSTPGAAVTWSRFSALGGGYAEQLTPTTPYTLVDPQGDMGYIIDEPDGTRTCLWLVDYSAHRMTATSLSPSPERDCGVQVLLFDGHAEPIHFYSVTGRQLTVSRDIEVAYNTLEYDAEAGSWAEKGCRETVEGIAAGEVRVPAPLCGTVFALSGDRFLSAWGTPVEVDSPYIEAYAVEAVTMAERQGGDAPDNQVKGGEAEDALGGSAPATVTFTAVPTDAVVFREWQVSRTSTFDDIDLRDDRLEFTHTFDELGTSFVRFVCDNASGACPWESETYTVDIGESSLLCPNAFSPGASEGVNDEWKVSYRSIVEFECSIFNRAGLKMCSFTDPAQGWDGRYHGKLVPAGVYYYVIRARGADGKAYKLSGDINIVNYK